MNGPLNCSKVGVCGGCPWGAKDFSLQASDKLALVKDLGAAVDVAYAPFSRVRDRADLVWEKRADGAMALGLYALEGRGVVDLEACPMMTPALEAWLVEFRRRAPPGVVRGSVRLRVSPRGERGVWLDFANADVKTLFEERSYLEWLSSLAFVEIGQRRKHLVWREGAPKLVDPELRAWFETYDREGAAIPLYGPVGGFSQTGFAANRALVKTVCELAEASGAREWLELFSGNGNFALALAARGLPVEAIEVEELAVEGLQKSLSERGLPVKVSRSDVYLKSGQLPPPGARGVLVDPPRAGLRQLLLEIEKGWRPSVLLYVSCFTEVFLADAKRLSELGYRLQALKGVDQFPFTPHSEWVALFRA